MYLAMTDKGDYGSTCLHLDVADAINLMVYSNPPTGFATWHIFADYDAEKLRFFISEKFPSSAGDPIHCQRHYLGPDLLGELELKYGVKPFTIVQHVNQAVIIPAGCPHQVCHIVPTLAYPLSSTELLVG